MAIGETEERTDPYLEQAFDWLLRVEEAPGDADLQRALHAWQAADVRHAEAWWRARKIWGLIGEVPADTTRWPAEPAPAEREPAAAVSTPQLGRRRRSGRRRRHRAGGIVVAALAVCMVVFLWPKLQLLMLADYSTGVGETRQVALQDGSVVYLGADSAISIDHSADQRGVRLLSGRAFFEVTPNAERPFVVNARNLEITVLGTAFDVHLGRRLYNVSVQHGSVAVHYDGEHESFDRQLSSGQQLRIARNDGMATLFHVPPESVAAWRRGRLFVHDRTVADVVGTLQRYYHGYIIIADDSLAERHVTGSYRLDNVDRALSGLVKPYQGHVRELTPFVRILQAP